MKKLYSVGKSDIVWGKVTKCWNKLHSVGKSYIVWEKLCFMDKVTSCRKIICHGKICNVGKRYVLCKTVQKRCRMMCHMAWERVT